MQRQRRNREPLFDLSAIVNYIILWGLFAAIAYGTKYLVMQGISASPTMRVGNEMLTLYEIHNTGAAFNLFAAHSDMIVMASFFAISIMALIVLFSSARLSQMAISAMSFLCAGISMNLYERINLGYVVDYIHINALPNFPVFNVPDVMIVVGAFCLILSVLTRR